jgi:hypothetical protein
MPPKKTLADQIDELDESDTDQGWVDAVRNPEHRERRVLVAFTRIFHKLQFCLTAQRHSRVVAHWALSAADPATETAAATTRATAKTKAPPRRDDLNHVGAAFPPTAREYPTPRSSCRHEQNGRTLLTAAGGRQGERKLYLWVCAACGSRWERVAGPANAATAAPAATASAAASHSLQPQNAPGAATTDAEMATDQEPPLTLDRRRDPR